MPLAGLRVVEFTHMVMGPTCGMVLADLGAEVIKVEPVEGDRTRHLLGAGAGFFPMFNRNKKSIALDLRNPEGLEVARKLAASADVVAQNFKPGVMTKYGLDYAALSQINPRLIYVNHTGFLAGPGLGESAADVCKALLGRNAPWAGVVLDADALNALAAGKYRGDLPANTILTPHPGEAARLLGLTVPEVQADREGAAVSLAEKYHCVAVLKGHHTLVAAPDGTVWRNETGNAGLAKGGSGDILAGLTAGLLAAGLKQGRTPEDAAVCAVWLHGAAADRCAKRRSMTAMLPGDLFEDLGWILGELGR